MTAPAPLTPAGDPAALTDEELTDEELAWFENGHDRVSGWGIDCAKCHMRYPCITVRLIAALRASRSEADEARAVQMAVDAAWRRERQELHEDLRSSRVEVERQSHRADDYANALAATQAELRAARAEVERLAALNDGLGAALKYHRTATCAEVHPQQDVFHPGGHPRSDPPSLPDIPPMRG